jgi:tRNA A37 methylthiotransferase MiaB
MSLKTPEYQLNYFTDPFDKKAEIVFLNTCAFISSGRDEASETVKKLLKAKKTVYLLGCAVQYYKKLQKKIRVGLIDNGSSFIHSLSKTLQELHYDVYILPSSQIDTIKENDYDFFVLSGMKH